MKFFIKNIFLIFISLNLLLIPFAGAENVFEPVRINEVQETKIKDQKPMVEKRFTPKKCFLNLDLHMANIMAPNTDNVAFAVGMLNPINLISTVVASPLILLFWPLKTLK